MAFKRKGLTIAVLGGWKVISDTFLFSAS